MTEKIYVTVTLMLVGNKPPATIQELGERAKAWEIHRQGPLPPALVEFPAESQKGAGFDAHYGSTATGRTS